MKIQFTNPTVTRSLKAITMRSLLILIFCFLVSFIEQSVVFGQTRKPTNTEIKRLYQQLEQIINLMKNNKVAYQNYMRDRRTSKEKQTRAFFINAWSEKEPGLAPFFGRWGGYENIRHIYPSNTKNSVCVITTGEGYGSVTTGVLSKGVIITNSGELLLKKGNYLGVAVLNKGKFIINLVNDIPLNSPTPLEPLPKLLDYLIESSDKIKISQEFNDNGCTTSLPNHR